MAELIISGIIVVVVALVVVFVASAGLAFLGMLAGMADRKADK